MRDQLIIQEPRHRGEEKRRRDWQQRHCPSRLPGKRLPNLRHRHLEHEEHGRSQNFQESGGDAAVIRIGHGFIKAVRFASGVGVSVDVIQELGRCSPLRGFLRWRYVSLVWSLHSICTSIPLIERCRDPPGEQDRHQVHDVHATYGARLRKAHRTAQECPKDGCNRDEIKHAVSEKGKRVNFNAASGHSLAQPSDQSCD